MADIFLSYASADLERVQPLIQALEAHGWSVWWDRNILPGQTYNQVIGTALNEANCVLVLWSHASVGSQWVMDEATRGQNRDALIPAMIDGDVVSPLGFGMIEAARLHDWQGESEHPEFQLLLRAVTAKVGEPASRAAILPGNIADRYVVKEPAVIEDEKSADGEPEPARFQPERNESKASSWVKPLVGVVVGILVIALLVFAYRQRLPIRPSYVVMVQTNPADSGLRLLDQRVEFRSGMRLEPGAYTLVVEREGYVTQEHPFEIESSDIRLDIELSKVPDPLPRTYKLTVRAIPTDSVIRFLDAQREYRPGVPLEPGTYTVVVEREGYLTQQRAFSVESRDIDLDVKLEKVPEPLPLTYRLTVRATPSDSTIKILNIRPVYQARMELAPGHYHIQVEKEGFKTRRQWISIVDRDVEVEIEPLELVPVPVSPPPDPPKQFTNSIGMAFELIPSGTFQMGSENGDSDEEPVHTVHISRAFYLGKTEVTQKQWKAVMGANPSYYKGDVLPVENVSWDDVKKFIDKLNEKEGVSLYRLPTEAEWEYAARAGSTTAYSFGGDESRLGEYAWFWDNADRKTHAVGQLKPNAWGLHDVHGNVWEWVQDWYAGYATDNQKDPAGPASGSDRVIRGGGWGSIARNCRSSYRGRGGPGARYSNLGFRLLRQVD